MKVFLVLKEDIVNYPPVLSIIKALQILKIEIIVLGSYTDEEQKRLLEGEGVIFANYKLYDGNKSLLNKYFQLKNYKRNVVKSLSSMYEDGDLVWIMHAENVLLLNKIVNKYKTIIHFFEYVDPKINWKYRLFAPFFDMGNACKDAFKVICCEYNRAHITKGLFSLDSLPIILPNKFFVSDRSISTPPKEVSDIIDEIKGKIVNKRVILYQGVFLDKERRLEEFIQAIKLLGENYVLIAMGRGTEMFDRLKKEYSSDNVIFVNFIKPPFHLLVTKLANIGILSYFPRPNSIGSVINPLYCAPNKTFEYGRYDIPMISNDVPALKWQFEHFQCGEIVPYPVTPEKIANKILSIYDNYDYYAAGAKKLYNSVDMVNIIKSTIN